MPIYNGVEDFKKISDGLLIRAITPAALLPSLMMIGAISEYFGTIANLFYKLD